MESIHLTTQTRDELLEITDEVTTVVKRLGVMEGVVLVYVPHTTAGVLINENADPTVVHDILADLDRLVPRDQSYYQHREGNSSSHTRASFIGTSEMVFVAEGRLQLGTWQGIFFCEFDGPRRRTVQVKVLAG